MTLAPSFQNFVNDNSIYRTQVVVFLTNHKKEEHLSILNNILQQYLPTEEDIVLYEDLKNPPRWKFQVQSKCWEVPTISEVFQKVITYKKFYEVTKNFSNSEYRKELKIEVAKKVLKKAREAEIDIGELNQEKIILWLNEPKKYCSELKSAQVKLSDLVSHLFKMFQENTVINTFQERQTALIEEIRESLKFRRVFVICGSCHGNPETSNFPEEAERLVNFLQANTKFTVINLENPKPVKKISN